ncbi:MAG: septum formation protein Maf [Flavobacteriales bacterium]|nr:septum formation protein Maf [Flavobacteriales bacterium]
MKLNAKGFQLILASQSPRRKQLMEQLGYSFTQTSKDTDESFPSTMKVTEVAEYLSLKKAKAYTNEIGKNDLLITSDTVVILDDIILGKPESPEEAFEMISSLSGQTHEVMTGVCLKSIDKEVSFSVGTTVHFKALSKEEITHYIDQYKPYDKAGAYGIQEWIGLIGVERIEGSFYNVVGFPAKAVYEAIENF